jgi:hypothetical protein
VLSIIFKLVFNISEVFSYIDGVSLDSSGDGPVEFQFKRCVFIRAFVAMGVVVEV